MRSKGRVPDRLGSGVWPHADAVPNRITLTFSSLHKLGAFFVISKLAVRLQALSVTLLFSWLGQKFFFSFNSYLILSVSLFPTYNPILFWFVHPKYQSSAVNSRIPQP